MPDILHISAHYGGGVGTVINSWTKNDTINNHRLSYLNKKIDNYGDPFNTALIGGSDIVVLHLWNHPSTFEFIINTDLPPCRLITWSHMSGLHAPYIYFNKLIDYFDKFIFTTPISYECKEIKNAIDSNCHKIDAIWSTCGVEKFDGLEKKNHINFNVGITGTADYGKLHKDFIEMSSSIKPDSIKFIVCTTDKQQHLIDRAMELNVFNRFSFEGRVDVERYLPLFDVFGYPLQPTHYGSCEQSLGEAMMCGCVPVVFNNPAERYIVKNMENGIVVNSKEEYVKAVEYLYYNRNELYRMSNNAKMSARQHYNVKNTVDSWNKIFKDIIKKDKLNRKWSNTQQESWAIYAISMGEYGKVFFDYVFYDNVGNNILKQKCTENIKNLYSTNSMFYSISKGSVRQYLDYFSGDKYIREWEKILNG